ncbi:hypothetical protein [Gorillibacterium timonense]|uniref:hypothetical protein n=1 Tax=Gorillibacterium timonense TaxID=1689269 RepID=UPI00071E1A1E|nr:hypothetical protein [Gorillibacterium timonense]
MNPKEREAEMIRRFQQDEEMMILVFAQWCVNHGLDPLALYTRAYPQQAANPALAHALELTVPKEEAGDIADDTLLSVLSLYDNADLAFVVSEEIARRKRG